MGRIFISSQGALVRVRPGVATWKTSPQGFHVTVLPDLRPSAPVTGEPPENYWCSSVTFVVKS